MSNRDDVNMTRQGFLITTGAAAVVLGAGLPTGRAVAQQQPGDPAQWSLRIEGEVEKPLVLRPDDLKKLPMITEDITIECTGNGRSFHKPQASGIQWAHGAIGNAQCKGVRLGDVLAMADVRPTGRHVAFEGADKPPTP